MATGWRRAAEIFLAYSGTASAAAHRNSPRSAILAYHNVVPSGESVVGDVSLHIDQATFARQLDFLQAHATVVPLSTVLETSQNPRNAGPCVAITFDDAYRGAMTAGLDELCTRGLPATVFVPPGLLGADGFWWDRLAPTGGGPLDAWVRDHGLGQLEGLDSRIIPWAVDQGLPLRELPDHARPVTSDELTRTSLPAGTTLGAHTWSHANLASLSDDDAESEMLRSKEWLASQTDAYVDWLAYPYGLWSTSVAERASRIFEGAVRVDGGLAVRRGERASSAHLVPRVNIPRGLSLEGLALRLSGLLI